MPEKLHSPKDEPENKRPHPNRQATLRDILELEARLPSKFDLSALEKRLGRLIKHPRFEWTIGPVQTKVQQETEQMEIKLTNEQQVTVTLNPKTDAGRPAQLDGKPTWEVISGSSTLEVAEDGKSALIVSSDDPGDTQILVKADADLGEGIEEISEVLDVKIAGATAKNLGITIGVPTVKPAPAP
jgi:hypothetical protein